MRRRKEKREETNEYVRIRRGPSAGSLKVMAHLTGSGGPLLRR
jgi:hypothetical protein